MRLCSSIDHPADCRFHQCVTRTYTHWKNTFQSWIIPLRPWSFYPLAPAVTLRPPSPHGQPPPSTRVTGLSQYPTWLDLSTSGTTLQSTTASRAHRSALVHSRGHRGRAWVMRHTRISRCRAGGAALQLERMNPTISCLGCGTTRQK